MRLFLVRHGQSEANRAGTLDGYGDAALTELGRAQAAQLAKQASAWNLRNAHLITSPMRRARHTADALAETLSLAPTEDARLTSGEGRVSLTAEPAGRDAAIADAWREGSALIAAASSEMAAAISDAWRHDGDLIAVSHRFPIFALLCHHYTRAAALPIVDKLGNCDALEIVRGDNAYLPPAHLPLPR